MPKYQSKIQISASADEVFRFASTPANMPQFLPTVKHAESQGPDRIRVKGEANGHAYDSDGWFRVDGQARRYEWASDGENDYKGQLLVEGDDTRAEVTVELNFDPKPGLEEEFKKQMGSRDAVIREGLDKALQSIKNLMEGKGGKVPSSADNGGYNAQGGQPANQAGDQDLSIAGV